MSEGNEIIGEDFPQIHSDLSPQVAGQRQGGAQGIFAGPDRRRNDLSSRDDKNEIRSLKSVEKDMISLALKRYEGRMSEMAHHLGVGRSTLYRKVAEYDLDEGTS